MRAAINGPHDPRNALGDARAEHDRILDQAFISTQEYATLFNGRASYIVVGRRGTGKSALFRELKTALAARRGTRVLPIAPDSAEVRPMHALVRAVSPQSYSEAKDLSSALWRYAITLEVISDLARLKHTASWSSLEPASRQLLGEHASRWQAAGGTCLERLYRTVTPNVQPNINVGTLLGAINPRLQFRELAAFLRLELEKQAMDYVILADALDEGFEPGGMEVAFVNGLVSAAAELSTHARNIYTSAFLRDNIFRVIQKEDDNFTRNLEGRVLRLHWDEQALFQLVLRRISVVFSPRSAPGEDETLREPSAGGQLWSSHVSQALEGMSGFRRVLRHTLYRPRDVITLLNAAFWEASRRGSRRISEEDIDKSADDVSRNRLSDLFREYEQITPGLPEIAALFQAEGPVLSVPRAKELLKCLEDKTRDQELQTELRVLGGEGILGSLHSVGFVGARQGEDGPYIFCHDGRVLDLELDERTSLMVHPCYWRALGHAADSVNEHTSEEIHDDYAEKHGLRVTSVALERRRREIDKHLRSLTSIAIGPENTEEFAEWLRRSLELLLLSGVRDLERNREFLHGAISSADGFWGELQTTYSTRSVVALALNAGTLETADVRLVANRARQLGVRVAFVCGRSEDAGIRKGPALEAVRSTYRNDSILIGYINTRAVEKGLQRLCTPGRAGEAARFLERIVEQTRASYLGVDNKKTAKAKRTKKQKPRCDAVFLVATETECRELRGLAASEFGWTEQVVNGKQCSYFVFTAGDGGRTAMVQCEMGSSGIGASASTTKEAIRELRPGAVIGVGIAFGLRPEKEQLGQVVVSKQLLNYEAMRLNAVGSLPAETPRGDKVHISPRLLSRFRSLANRWTFASAEFGLFLTGEKLIDNLEVREKLRKLEPEALAGDMEGMGLYTSAEEAKTDWAIVKAISDWADGNKAEDKEVRQKTAARNAAHFVLSAAADGLFARE